MSDYADNLRKSMINKTRRFMRMVQEMQEKDDAALREQVIRMAREAGMPVEWLEEYKPIGWGQFERFFLLAAAAGAAAEREACAKVCEEADLVEYEHCMVLHTDGPATLRNAAAAIRARGEKCPPSL